MLKYLFAYYLMIALLYTLVGIPTGCIVIHLLHYYCRSFYNVTVSVWLKVGIFTFIVCSAFIRGYTGNDLVENCKYYFL